MRTTTAWLRTSAARVVVALAAACAHAGCVDSILDRPRPAAADASQGDSTPDTGGEDVAADAEPDLPPDTECITGDQCGPGTACTETVACLNGQCVYVPFDEPGCWATPKECYPGDAVAVGEAVASFSGEPRSAKLAGAPLPTAVACNVIGCNADVKLLDEDGVVLLNQSLGTEFTCTGPAIDQLTCRPLATLRGYLVSGTLDALPETWSPGAGEALVPELLLAVKDWCPVLVPDTVVGRWDVGVRSADTGCLEGGLELLHDDATGWVGAFTPVAAWLWGLFTVDHVEVRTGSIALDAVTGKLSLVLDVFMTDAKQYTFDAVVRTRPNSDELIGGVELTKAPPDAPPGMLETGELRMRRLLGDAPFKGACGQWPD